LAEIHLLSRGFQFLFAREPCPLSPASHFVSLTGRPLTVLAKLPSWDAGRSTHMTQDNTDAQQLKSLPFLEPNTFALVGNQA
jgi:hypothetical protein